MKKPTPTYPRPTEKLQIRWGRIFFLLLIAFGIGSWFAINKKDSIQEIQATRQTNTPPSNHNTTGAAASSVPATQVPVTSTVPELRPLQSTPVVVSQNPTPPTPDTPQAATKNTEERKPSAPPSKPSPFKNMTLQQVTAALATNTFIGSPPQEWGERLNGVTYRLPSQTQSDKNSSPRVALTLDACGGKKGSSYDSELVAFLRQEQIPAVIFVTSIWIKNNPDALRELAADPLFRIEAHGKRHKPASINGRSVFSIQGTKDLAELVQEVEGNARDIEAHIGRRPQWYRSGTAYYDDVAVKVIQKLGFEIAGYSLSVDQGATLSASKVAALTRQAKDGDILLAHLNHPKSGTREGLREGLPYLKEHGFIFILLEQ